ncbi:MAG: DEAD/DEAH box helicase family protein [Candidatus Cloacimonetes bacterium]|nr:DEAD/DEAH box helicase family protein [Candidatus Cloacimonadota bacterium]
MGNKKEATARIKINDHLKKTGWRFFDDEDGQSNICLEMHIKPTRAELESFGDNFEGTKSGFADYILLSSRNFPLAVLEAKKEELDPLVGKEQARTYARRLKARFIILSNGSLHYLWDLLRGNPQLITTFPSQTSLEEYKKIKPDRDKLVNEEVDATYILASQDADFAQRPEWQNENLRKDYLENNNFRLLRDYQVRAVKSVQYAAKYGEDRYLFEMATGTGKTLVAAAVIKLFLRTQNAGRVLFLVDRIELERQADTNFNHYLGNDYIIKIYKEHKDDWNSAAIIISTVQSLTVENRYLDIFSPTDFDLVISDEAHRSINGNARALFEYFPGYKLGLTATPRDFLKNVDIEKLREDNPRALERRMLLDTYKTFGCEGLEPTFRYSLLDGVKEGFLVNPRVIDARTEVTTQLLSEEGYAVVIKEGEEEKEEQYFHTDFEKKFFSEKTNYVFCRAFMENALRDPITNEIGKTIIFCVRQKHATKVTQILNQLAEEMFPGKYNSDFAVQITSQVTDSQVMSGNFANNNLLGKTRFLPDYKSSRARICVTVGMMTTGFDCRDILNLVMLRPIFSPTDFVQMKGRGTRRYTFYYENRIDGEIIKKSEEKVTYYLFDFFANCEYFEEKFDYDEILELPPIGPSAPGGAGPEPPARIGGFEYTGKDVLTLLKEEQIGEEGMKVDRMMYQKFEQDVKSDAIVRQLMENEEFGEARNYVLEHYLNQKETALNLDKIRHLLLPERNITLDEILQYMFGLIPKLKSKEELLEEEFKKFQSIYKLDNVKVKAAWRFFAAFITDTATREIIKNKDYGRLVTNAMLDMEDIRALNDFKNVLQAYIRDYVPLNKFE